MCCSGGELQRVLRAGGDPDKIIFSGVGKLAGEMELALDSGIHCFNVESEQELDQLNAIAGHKQCIARISFRVNPDVDAKTHPYISTGLKENKFGINFDDAEAVYLKARDLPHIDVIGIDCHIGSQLTEISPFVDALERLLFLVQLSAVDSVFDIKMKRRLCRRNGRVHYAINSMILTVLWS
jgi:diaminopimelate decarboxylase